MQWAHFPLLGVDSHEQWQAEELDSQCWSNMLEEDWIEIDGRTLQSGCRLQMKLLDISVNFDGRFLPQLFFILSSVEFGLLHSTLGFGYVHIRRSRFRKCSFDFHRWISNIHRKLFLWFLWFHWFYDSIISLWFSAYLAHILTSLTIVIHETLIKT